MATTLLDQARWGKDAKASRYNVLLFGFPGSGKTTLAAGAPRPLVIEVDENGHVVLDTPELRDHARYFYLRDFGKVAQLVRLLAKDPLLQEIDTIVVDTFTELQTLDRLSRLTGDLLLDTSWRFDENIYQNNNFTSLVLLREILKLGKNTIVICHLEEKDEGENRKKDIHLRAALSPKVLQGTMASMDGVFFLSATGQNRRLRVEATTQLMTKTRVKFPKGEFVNPKWSDLEPYLNKILKTKNTETTEKEEQSDEHVQ